MKSLAAFACAGALCATACVSQQTYDATRAEADDASRTLDSERAELRELEQQISTLHALNRTADAMTTEIRSAIQREMDAAALYRQRSDDTLAALQTQVAALVNQHRALGRELADAKQEGVSLQASVTQYKRELDESRLPPFPVRSPAPAPPPPMTPSPSPAPVPAPVVVPPAAPAASAPHESAGSPAPVKPIAPRPAKAEPAEADDSWTGMIKSWVSTLWDWIFG